MKGFKTYRHADNPREEALHSKFIEMFTDKDMDFIIFGNLNDKSGKIPNDNLTVREQRIVISTVQWLGSSLGQSFIRSLGYCEEKEYKPKLHHISSRLAKLEKQLDCIPTWIKSIFI